MGEGSLGNPATVTGFADWVFHFTTGWGQSLSDDKAREKQLIVGRSAHGTLNELLAAPSIRRQLGDNIDCDWEVRFVDRRVPGDTLKPFVASRLQVGAKFCAASLMRFCVTSKVERLQ